MSAADDDRTPMSDAERQRLCYRRRQEGTRVLRTEAFNNFVEFLIRKGWLKEGDAGDDKALARAINALHESAMRRELAPDE